MQHEQQPSWKNPPRAIGCPAEGRIGCWKLAAIARGRGRYFESPRAAIARARKGPCTRPRHGPRPAACRGFAPRQRSAPPLVCRGLGSVPTPCTRTLVVSTLVGPDPCPVLASPDPVTPVWAWVRIRRAGSLMRSSDPPPDSLPAGPVPHGPYRLPERMPANCEATTPSRGSRGGERRIGRALRPNLC